MKVLITNKVGEESTFSSAVITQRIVQVEENSSLERLAKHCRRFQSVSSISVFDDFAVAYGPRDGAGFVESCAVSIIK